MAVSFFSFWSGLVDVLFNVAWFFWGEEVEKSLKGLSFVFVLDVMERNRKSFVDIE